MIKSAVLAVVKPIQITSFDVIRRLRKITGIRKIGHTGTLDPFASGLMILCLGKYTRLTTFLNNYNKEYLVEVKFGFKTDTGDISGKVIAKSELPRLDHFDHTEFESRIRKISSQIPPRYSAIKVAGRRAYDLARKGKDFQLKSRSIKIHKFKILTIGNTGMSYRTVVSKGTYIRSLSEDIGKELQTLATTCKLQRTAIGAINLDRAIWLDDLTDENWFKSSLEIPELLPEMNRVELDLKQVKLYRNGSFIELNRSDQSTVMVLSKKGEFLGIARSENNILKPRLVIK